jgi:hypothetical protein
VLILKNIFPKKKELNDYSDGFEKNNIRITDLNFRKTKWHHIKSVPDRWMDRWRILLDPQGGSHTQHTHTT